MQIFRVFQAVPYTNLPIVKDVMASLHSYFTSNMLIGLAILLSYKQFEGRPIDCMVPLEFPGSWTEYAENYCFAQDTYYVPFQEPVENYSAPQKHESRWIPFFLLFQAGCFKLPTFIWKYFAGQSGMKVGEILRLATNEANVEPNTRHSNVEALATHLQGALRFHSRVRMKHLIPHKLIRILNVKYSSHYVYLIYMVSKVAFFLNVVLQWKLLNRYLVPSMTHSFGFYALKSIITGNQSWENSGIFPRVTMCDFEVREMGQVQNHTIQCILLLNIFTEKVFVILWTWYFVLASITLCNISSWLFVMMNPRSAEHFVHNHMEMSGESVFANESEQGLEAIQAQVGRFIRKYLRTDGMFLLRHIAQHADVVFTTELVAKLWETHYRIEKGRQGLKESDQKLLEQLKRFKIIDARAAHAAKNYYSYGDHFDGQRRAARSSPLKKVTKAPKLDSSLSSVASSVFAGRDDALRQRRPSRALLRSASMESLQSLKKPARD
ncbi:innexin family protein [Aphelenchoides avenae]|nr:innexin family protein [Aphelenchus avenae]